MRSDLPQGTVTLVFTDIEGSTRLVDALGGAYADVLADHRRAVRSAFQRHHGVEVDTQGDAFFYAFERASEAVAAATELQLEIADSNAPRVRIGIHTGEPALTEEGYVGRAVNIGARLCAAAHGGQVVVSSATFDLARPSDSRNLGDHELKDVGAVGIHQVGGDSFPPLRTGSRRGNLPVSLPRFVGRREEARDLVGFIEEGARIVTVHGPAGVGKTRIALHVAASMSDRFGDGVWFIDLASVSTHEDVEPAILRALDTPGPLAGHLRGREALLVLDNLEQVAEWGLDLAALVDVCPRCVFLVTSRELLQVAAEQAFPLAALEDETAVELFKVRAAAASPNVQLNDEEVRVLCRKLDNLPLAIELAAARVRMYTVDELTKRMESGLALKGGARDRPERHQTLRSAIQWSYELLSLDERRLFASTSVFAGGFSLEAAEQVVNADPEVVGSLVNKSLLQAALTQPDGTWPAAAAAEMRFRMLNSVRELAAEVLATLEEATAIRDRHAEYFAEFGASAAPELIGRSQETWLRRVATEYENLSAAMEWWASRGSFDLMADLAVNLIMYWYNRAVYAEGLRWLEQALERTDPERPARVEALWGTGLLHVLGGDPARAEQLLNEGLALAESRDNVSLQGRSLNILGLLALFSNDTARAAELYERAITCFRQTSEPFWLADVLGTLSSILPLRGEFQRAESLGREALELARLNEERQGMRMALFGLGLIDYRLEHPQQARIWCDEGLRISRQLEDRWFISYFLWLLSLISSDEGRIQAAAGEAAEALDVAREVGAPLLLCCALEASGRAARLSGDADAAVRWLSEATRLEATGTVPGSYMAAVQRELGLALGIEKDEGRVWLERSLSTSRDASDPWSERKSRDALENAGVTPS